MRPGSRGPPTLGHSTSVGGPSGYQTKRVGEGLDGRMLRLENVRRFDGAARADQPWDNLRRDPELWWNHGNCYVHLYGQGQSRRGPAFKLPFSTLQEQKCFPLIERFLVAWDQSDFPHRPITSEPSKEPRAFQLLPKPTPSALPDPIQRRMARGRKAGVATARPPPDRWAGRVDLYIPAPPLSDRRQALAYHLATRNFFAWAMGRSMVGEHLGRALATLLESMHEFREAGADNVKDLIAYMDEEGYLDFNGLPGNALAVLYLAENFRMRDLYIDSFVHCVGMSEILYRCPEYHVRLTSWSLELSLLCSLLTPVFSCPAQNISSRSRRMIRKSRGDMDKRLDEAGSMIRTFLEDDLAESKLGLTSGVRAHLDRFRAFVHSFYASKFGYYPPLPLEPNTNVFPAHVYRSMGQDFEALYNYLVDRSFTTTDSSPALAQGGICVLQSVDAFDQQHGYDSLPHPLPLLPKLGGKAGSSASPASGPDGGSPTTSPAPSMASSKRRSWFSSAVAAAVGSASRHQSSSSGGGSGPDGKLVSHAALMTATNSTDVYLLENRFVCAYRRFEEISVLSATTGNKFDRAEAKISLLDARKVRWILVYCMHQTLRACTAIPAEVRCASDQELPPYSLCAEASELPPWEEQAISYESVEGDPLHVASDAIGSAPSLAPPAIMLDIRPDVDYYALTHRDETRPTALSRSASDGSAYGAVRPSTATNNAKFKVPPRRSSLSSPSRPTTSSGGVPDTTSLTRSSSASGPFRKTLNKLRGGVASSASSFVDRPLASPPLVPETFELPPKSMWRKPRRLSYQEIFVQGYGNGTLNVINVGDTAAPKHVRNISWTAKPAGSTYNNPPTTTTTTTTTPSHDDGLTGGARRDTTEKEEDEEVPVKVAPEAVANRSASTASNSSNSSTATKTSNATTAATSLSSSVPSSPKATEHGGLNPWDKIAAAVPATVPEQPGPPTPPPGDADADAASAAPATSPVVTPASPPRAPTPAPIPPRAPGRMLPYVASTAPNLPERSHARRTWAGPPGSAAETFPELGGHRSVAARAGAVDR
ncbi:hypothetical protein MAPG_09186 [Magnaporthiopsis poae ATCC 64411]|uniref:DUF8004 domain-containing protein n=1 Tax=Magnaporthiopsis poae (strain ATCC 64411 / 73-15) TaxID=644358 RepID=A0A0C4E9A7_MAGP6|nr:hypothetical protein MAPG_09186 [Magnaporthiopsis poae ATCC 64411]